MAEYLFVYGTLHPDLAPAEMQPVVRRLTLLGPATIRGTRLELGEYPGLLTGPQHDDLVAGTVFALPDDPGVLAALDAYEGYLQDDPRGSLFVREQRVITRTESGPLLCWVYLWNGDASR